MDIGKLLLVGGAGYLAYTLFIKKADPMEVAKEIVKLEADGSKLIKSGITLAPAGYAMVAKAADLRAKNPEAAALANKYAATMVGQSIAAAAAAMPKFF